MGEPGAREIGPKADSLRRLAEAGLPVPEARFLGCEAFREHAARAGIAGLLDAAAGARSTPATVADAIAGTPLDPAIEARLAAWHAELGGGAVSVRSSANAEDLPGASFAGQHGTYFVSDPAALPLRVRDCWASLFSERAVRYRERNAIPHGDVRDGRDRAAARPGDRGGRGVLGRPDLGRDDITVEGVHRPRRGARLGQGHARPLRVQGATASPCARGRF